MTIKELENMKECDVTELTIEDVIDIEIEALRAYAATIPNIDMGIVNFTESIETIFELIKDQRILNYVTQLYLEEEKEERKKRRERSLG